MQFMIGWSNIRAQSGAADPTAPAGPVPSLAGARQANPARERRRLSVAANSADALEPQVRSSPVDCLPKNIELMRGAGPILR